MFPSFSGFPSWFFYTTSWYHLHNFPISWFKNIPWKSSLLKVFFLMNYQSPLFDVGDHMCTCQHTHWFDTQGSTIGVCRVCTYAYFYWSMHNFRHAYVDTYSFFSLLFFKVFKILLALIFSYCLKTYYSIFDL